MPEKGQTSQILQVQLPSRIAMCRWERSDVSSEATIRLLVYTSYVAQNTPVELELYNQDNKKVDSLKSHVLDQTCSFEWKALVENGRAYKGLVSIPDLSLQVSTPPLRLYPPLQLKKVSWFNEKGESITQISEETLVQVELEVEGVPEQTPCSVALILKEMESSPVALTQKMTYVSNGKLQLSWPPQYPTDELKHPIQSQREPTGREYEHPLIAVRIFYQGQTQISDWMDYTSWAIFCFGNQLGTVQLLMPDGSKQSFEIPEDGILRVPSCGVGEIKIIDEDTSDDEKDEDLTALQHLFSDIKELEDLALADNYNLQATISAFRKIWYDDPTYTAAWYHLIPGARQIRKPPSWQQGRGLQLCQNLYGGIGREKWLHGMPVDISHLFAGADARNHPSDVELYAIHLRSNIEACTWVGDLGSVVAEFIHKTHISLHDVAHTRQKELEDYFDRSPSLGVFQIADQTSDLDGLFIDFAASGSIYQGLLDYYAKDGPWQQRSQRFLNEIYPKAQTKLSDEVYQACVAYSASKKWVADVYTLMNPKVGIHIHLPWIGDVDSYTLWEAYVANCQWVIDIWLERLRGRSRG